MQTFQQPPVGFHSGRVLPLPLSPHRTRSLSNTGSGMSDEDAFYAAYLDNVKTDLIMNSKPVIHTLTQIAGENKQFACAVVDALRTHIKECRKEYMLCALYLCDSIVKNVGEPYVELFSRDIAEMFLTVWNSVPENRPSLKRVLDTWVGAPGSPPVFPAKLLARIHHKLESLENRGGAHGAGGTPPDPRLRRQGSVGEQLMDPRPHLQSRRGIEDSPPVDPRRWGREEDFGPALSPSGGRGADLRPPTRRMDSDVLYRQRQLQYRDDLRVYRDEAQAVPPPQQYRGGGGGARSPPMGLHYADESRLNSHAGASSRNFDALGRGLGGMMGGEPSPQTHREPPGPPGLPPSGGGFLGAPNGLLPPGFVEQQHHGQPFVSQPPPLIPPQGMGPSLSMQQQPLPIGGFDGSGHMPPPPHLQPQMNHLQPQMQVAQHMISAVPPPMFNRTPPPQQMQSTVQEPPQPQQPPLDLLSSLLSSGLISLPGAPAAAPLPVSQPAAVGAPPRSPPMMIQSAPPLQVPAQPPPMALPPPKAPLLSVPLTFSSEAFESSEKLKGKFLDLKWQRKRRVKSNQSASRAWFGSSEHWVSGTTGLSEAAPSAFFTEEPEDAPKQQVISVPADETQTACAISGEKFEEFFDEQEQVWRYRDAKRLTGAEAAEYGVPDGSIVLVSVLTPASVLDAHIGSLVRVTSDMQEVANELSEAADRSSDPKRGFEATGGSEAQPPEDRNANKKLKMEDNGFSRKAED